MPAHPSARYEEGSVVSLIPAPQNSTATIYCEDGGGDHRTLPQPLPVVGYGQIVHHGTYGDLSLPVEPIVLRYGKPSPISSVLARLRRQDPEKRWRYEVNQP